MSDEDERVGPSRSRLVGEDASEEDRQHTDEPHDQQGRGDVGRRRVEPGREDAAEVVVEHQPAATRQEHGADEEQYAAPNVVTA